MESPTPRAANPARTGLPVALVCLGLLAGLFLRRPEMFLRPQFWAEDGAVFFVQADTLGLCALAEPHAGYHHLLLRLVAGVAAPLDARFVPAVYFAASLACLLLVARALFSDRIDLQGRPACALALVLVPHTGEVFGNLANLQWVGALGLVWLLLARDARTPGQHLLDAALALGLGLTGVFSVLLAPLFILRTAQRRTPGSVAVAVLIGIAAAIQTCTLWRTVAPESASALSALSAVHITGLRLVWAMSPLVAWWPEPSRALTVALGVALLAALAGAGGWPGPSRPLRLTLVTAFAVFCAGALWRHRAEPGVLDYLGNGDRYFYVPKVLACWLLLQGWTVPRLRPVVAVCLASVLAVTALRWRYERLTDLDWPAYARRIEAGEAVPAIPVNPDGTFAHPGRH